MNKKILIQELKRTYKAIDDVNEKFRKKLFKMTLKMSIKDLQEVCNDADIELHFAEENYKEILKK